MSGYLFAEEWAGVYGLLACAFAILVMCIYLVCGIYRDRDANE